MLTKKKIPRPPKPLRGARLKHAISAGIHWFSNFRQDIDAINVFPVPDGDTGKNMHHAFQSAYKEIRCVRKNSVSAVAKAAAHGALMGGRGSSGMILSGFFAGFAEGVGDRDVLTADEFVQALHIGCVRARERIENPREGTILTVGEAAAAKALRESETTSNLHQIIVSALEAARQALDQTKDQMPVLKQNRVVDAGGLGLVCFFEGVVRYLTKEPLDYRSATWRFRPSRPLAVQNTEVYDEHYCCEFILEQCVLNRDALLALFKPLGRELMIAFAETGTYKIHVHAEDAEGLLRQAGSWGTVSWRKVEDMRQQHQDVFGWKQEAPKSATRMAIVTDSTADFPAEDRHRHGIRMVPLSVYFGDAEYLDGVNLSAEQFYQKLKSGADWPTTSQPPQSKFTELYQALQKEGVNQVLVLTISRGLSGTYQSAVNAAAGLEGMTIRVVDSNSVCLGLGYLAAYARVLAEDGLDLETITARIREHVSKIGIYFSVESLNSLERGGRITKTKVVLGNLIGLRPILNLVGTQGTIAMVSKSFSTRRTIRKVARMAADHVRKHGKPCFGTAVVYSGDPVICLRVRRALAETGVDFGAIQDHRIGAVVGSHLGPDGWGIVVC